MRQAHISIPYGVSSLEAEVVGQKLLFNGEPEQLDALDDFGETLVERLESPTAGEPLRDLAKLHTKALILVEDNTRHTPVHRILPVLLDHLNSAGLPDERIEILMAGGTHRLMTHQELVDKVGGEAYRRIRIAQHNCFDLDSLVDLGVAQVGRMRIPIHVNKSVLSGGLVIGLGSIVPHSAAGFSGGAKIVQPGVCGVATTAATHIAEAFLDEIPLGNPENPCRLGMEEVARRAHLGFIVNVVQDPKGRLLEIVTGDFVAAHRAGAAISRRAYAVPIPRRADILVVSSSPADIDWWQAEKGLIAAYFAVSRGGCIVFAAPCSEGLAQNHPQLPEWLRLSHSDALNRASDVDPATTEADLIAADVAAVNARIREHAAILIVTDGLSDADVATLGYRRMPSLQAAVDYAAALRPAATIGVLPHGGVSLPVVS
jgi:nickel-dependent lactate racemase